MEVDVELLLSPPDPKTSRWPAAFGSGDLNDELEDEEDELDGEEQIAVDTGTRTDFSEMLVFSPSTLSDVLDLYITEYPTQSLPSSRRALPANALFRYAKFAQMRDDFWLAELVEGIIERIEEGAYVSAQSVCDGISANT
jgi:hypothetical protein